MYSQYLSPLHQPCSPVLHFPSFKGISIEQRVNKNLVINLNCFFSLPFEKNAATYKRRHLFARYSIHIRSFSLFRREK